MCTHPLDPNPAIPRTLTRTCAPPRERPLPEESALGGAGGARTRVGAEHSKTRMSVAEKQIMREWESSAASKQKRELAAMEAQVLTEVRRARRRSSCERCRRRWLAAGVSHS